MLCVDTVHAIRAINVAHSLSTMDVFADAEQFNYHIERVEKAAAAAQGALPILQFLSSNSSSGEFQHSVYHKSLRDSLPSESHLKLALQATRNAINTLARLQNNLRSRDIDYILTILFDLLQLFVNISDRLYNASIADNVDAPFTDDTKKMLQERLSSPEHQLLTQIGETWAVGEREISQRFLSAETPQSEDIELVERVPQPQPRMSKMPRQTQEQADIDTDAINHLNENFAKIEEAANHISSMYPKMRYSRTTNKPVSVDRQLFVDAYSKIKQSLNESVALRDVIEQQDLHAICRALIQTAGFIDYADTTTDPQSCGAAEVMEPLIMQETKQTLRQALTPEDKAVINGFGEYWVLSREEYDSIHNAQTEQATSPAAAPVSVSNVSVRSMEEVQVEVDVREEIEMVAMQGEFTNRPPQPCPSPHLLSEPAVDYLDTPPPNRHTAPWPEPRQEPVAPRHEPITVPMHEPDPDYDQSVQPRKVKDTIYIAYPPTDYLFDETADELVIQQKVKADKVETAFITHLRDYGASLACCVYTLRGDNPRQLCAYEGEYVEIINSQFNWWLCRNMYGQIGFVPSTILRPVELAR